MSTATSRAPFLAKRPFLRYFLPLGITTSVLVVVGFIIATVVETNKILDSFRATQVEFMDTIRGSAVDRLATAAGDLSVLIQQDVFLDLSDDPTPAELERIERFFVGLSTTRGQYDQVRFIDADGNERVRVDLEGDAATPIDDLQYKGDRYYFTNTIGLEPGHIYVSQLDLNVEGDSIEYPLKPMLRLATPVADASGAVRGILIINYLGALILDQLEPQATAIADHFHLINEDGYWMIHPNPELEWAFMFDDNDAHLSTELPFEWSRMNRIPEGQFETSNGIFTHKKLFPMDAMREQARAVSTDQGRTLEWIAYSWIPLSELETVTRTAAASKLFDGITILIGALALSALTAFALARQWTNRFNLREAEFVFGSSAEGIMITDHENRILRVNPAFTEITGYTEEDAVDRRPDVLQSGHHDEAFYQAMWQSLDETGRWKGEIWDRRKDGSVYPQLLSISSIRDEQGHIDRFVGVFSDITKEVEEARILEYMATHDPLTGLANRAMATTQLEASIAHTRRHGGRIAVLFMDLDGFKAVNDQHGHATGDALLQEIANRLTDEIRASDTVARLGGDEFLLMLTEAGDDPHIETTVQRILDRVAEPVTIGEFVVQVTGSIGIAATTDGTAEDGEKLIRSADLAMYTAKKAGSGFAWGSD